MKRFWAIPLGLALLAAACGRPEDRYVGTWAGTLQYDTEAAEALIAMLVPEMRAETIKQVNSLDLGLELLADGTYVLEYKNSASSGTASGTWTLANDESQVSLSEPKMGDGDLDNLVHDILGAEGEPVPFVLDKGKKGMARDHEFMGVSLTLTFTKDAK
ncbi:MAG: hypothetical protein WD716_13365 [Fimbriimonadaceae bacterium]